MLGNIVLNFNIWISEPVWSSELTSMEWILIYIKIRMRSPMRNALVPNTNMPQVHICIAPLTSSVFDLCISQPADLNLERGNFIQAGKWRGPLPFVCMTHPELTPTTCYKGKAVRYFGSIVQAGSCTSHTRHFFSSNQIFPGSANNVDLILVPLFQTEEFFQTF